MPVLYDFHEVEQLLSVEHLHAEVVDDEQVRLCELGKEAVQAAGHSGERDLLEEAVQVVVGHLQAIHACLVAERGSEPALAGPGGSGDEHRDALAHVVAGGEVQHFLLVHSPPAVADDLVDGGMVAEVRVLDEPCVTALPAAVRLCLYEQLQAVLQ